MVYYLGKTLYERHERGEKYIPKEKIYSVVVGEKLSELNSLKFY